MTGFARGSWREDVDRGREIGNWRLEIRISGSLLAAEVFNGTGEQGEEVAGDGAGGAELAAEVLGGEAVEIDAEARGFERGNALGDEAGYDAGKDIARAAGGKDGVGEGADASGTVRRGDDRIRALEHECHVPLGGEAAGDGQAIGLNVGYWEAGEAGELAGVRGDDRWDVEEVRPVVDMREVVESVGVEGEGVEDPPRPRLA